MFCWVVSKVHQILLLKGGFHHYRSSWTCEDKGSKWTTSIAQRRLRMSFIQNVKHRRIYATVPFQEPKSHIVGKSKAPLMSPSLPQHPVASHSTLIYLKGFTAQVWKEKVILSFSWWCTGRRTLYILHRSPLLESHMKSVVLFHKACWVRFFIQHYIT